MMWMRLRNYIRDFRKKVLFTVAFNLVLVLTLEFNLKFEKDENFSNWSRIKEREREREREIEQRGRSLLMSKTI